MLQRGNAYHVGSHAEAWEPGNAEAWEPGKNISDDQRRSVAE